ncbi:spore coat protein X [Bacillus megaterium]|nr:spore coat protein X [Priestia megaterium]
MNFNSNALIGTETIQKILSKQISNSVIVVKNSCNVNISITDTQTAIILQSLLQVLTFILTLIGLGANSIRLITVEVYSLQKLYNLAIIKLLSKILKMFMLLQLILIQLFLYKVLY